MWGPPRTACLNRVLLSARGFVRGSVRKRGHVAPTLDNLKSTGCGILYVCPACPPVALNLRECYFRALNQGEGGRPLPRYQQILSRHAKMSPQRGRARVRAIERGRTWPPIPFRIGFDDLIFVAICSAAGAGPQRVSPALAMLTEIKR